jgi:DNA-binding transcriptional MerR regulator/methylmalonyl-CoA mutase cobalamin-binding subunit
MYTIKEAAARSGLPIATIRAWERRYDVVEPARTAAGYRLYDDAAVDRLIAMRQLVEVEGVRPSQAADQVRDDAEAVHALVDRARSAAETSRSAAATASGESVATDRAAVVSFRDAVRRMDLVALESLLDEVLGSQRFERAVETVVFPALRAVGDDWASGEIDVAQEHAASETVRRRFSRAFDAAGRPGSPVDVVIGLPPGRQHELGALAFSVAARRAGLGVLYLGANVPVESWVAALERTDARLVVLGVIGREDVALGRAVAEGLAEATPRATVAVGGRGAAGVAAAAGVVALPEALDAAVETVHDLLAGATSQDR